MSSDYESDSPPEAMGSGEEDLEEEGEEEEGLGEEEYSAEEDSDGNEIRSDEDLRTKIFSTLKVIKTPSAIAYSAVDSSLPNPVICLPLHGTLGLPLSTDDAQKIISQASQSPFGKGEKTVIDTTVRKSWELNPNQFSLKNPAWNRAIKRIVITVTRGLGLENAKGISAELYKFLLYEPGAFFKPHKDSEKAPGMFATLVVCLPSPHEGGKLVVTHDNEKYEFETARSSDFGYTYAAWYSDITHEVLPVVSGYRLMLTYNLIRETGFEIPSYDLVCGRVKELSTLLEQYTLQLEKKDGKLPPVLLHKLKHKYTQASLKFNMLKPPDLAQVQMLAHLSSKLGFDIYLATFELEILKDDECDDEEFDRSESLINLVELSGKVIVESLYYPYGALIDPEPRGKGKADEEKHEGPTGNEGCPAKYWYRDAVVVLVPPSKQLDFVFQFASNGSVIEPLFSKLMQEFSKDPAQNPKLEKLCELALKQKPKEHSSYYRSQNSEPILPYIQQAAATALDLGRIDLFDEACNTTQDKIMLDNARMVGRWAASNGVATMTDRLMKGLRVASPIAKKVEFIKAVAEGFETAVPEPSLAEKVSLKEWSDEAIFTVIAELTTLTKDDGLPLAQLCNTMDWNHFESKVKPIILKAITMTKITFIKELMSTLQQEFDEKQRSFIEMVIRNIWNEFVFDGKCPEPVPEPTSSFYWMFPKSKPVHKDYLNGNDVLNIVESTITVLSLESVETIIISAILTAIPGASKECAKELFPLLVQMILKNELPGFRSPTKDTVPPPSHKSFVQALLTKFLLENVGLEPQAPTNWSLPAGSCDCKDCSVVNRFLQDPAKESFNFLCSKPRRLHLHQKFTNASESSYDVKTIRRRSPYVWQIKKHRRSYQEAHSEWVKNTDSAIETLSVLKKEEFVDGRLEAYLQPYYSSVMSAIVKELPDLQSLTTTAQLLENNENVAPAHNQSTSQKREASNIDPLEDELAKRTRL